MQSMLSSLLELDVARRTFDTGFACFANRRVRKLDGLPIAATQTDTLMRLVCNAANTQFGKDHDFQSIRSLDDYRERVPLRDYEAFWSEYWQHHYPDLSDQTWPGETPWFALSSGTTSDKTKYIPVSHAMMASNRRAAWTALSWYRHARANSRLFSGKLFFLGGSTALHELGGGRFMAGDLSGIAAREAPRFLEAFAFPPSDLAFHSDWEIKIERLAERSANLPITMISGVPSWLLILFERLRGITGRNTIAEIWPRLELIIHGGTSFEPYRSLFREIVGSPSVQFLETYPASEGFIAAEDPRYGMLRIIPDHNIFFEFVPVDELASRHPTRHSLSEVETGVQYAVVLTTCAGLWSYVIGDTVCFESGNPPLIRFTGRTKQSLSAFGEHLIGEEIEKAVSQAAERFQVSVVDFHVGPVFPIDGTGPGYHHFLVELAGDVDDRERLSQAIDQNLIHSNDDYAAHRAGNVGMDGPLVSVIRRGGFARWMKSRGKLGGQHKVPRIDGTGRLTFEIASWMQSMDLLRTSKATPTRKSELTLGGMAR